MKRKTFILFIATLLAALAAAAEGWPQWGQNPQHTGTASGLGQPPRQVLQNIVSDPFAEQIRADPLAEDGLSVHYQTPLVDGDDVYIEVKTGTYTPRPHWETQVWNERRLHWEHGALVPEWSFASDWKPVPYGSSASGPTWEPVFHGVLAGRYLYVPGFGGSIFKLDKRDGRLVTHISPFDPDLATDTFTAGPLSVDAAGNVYYHVTRLAHDAPWTEDVVDSWLVKVSPAGQVRKASYASLLPGAPRGDDLCLGTFPTSQLPWPPSPDAVPPSAPCGSQRPGLNSALTLAPDGTIYTVTLAHFSQRTSYLVAVRPDLTPKWTSSLRDRLHDGCNVLLPPNGNPGGCRTGAPDGVDPSQNRPGAGRVIDNSTSSPVVLPDGSVLYGAFTRFNYSQGHLMKWSAQGRFLGAYPFGWDLTPAVWPHHGTYSILLKENRYGDSGSYCGDPTACPLDRNATNPAYPEAFYLTQLAPDLTPEWQYRNTNPLACTRQPDGTVSCVSGPPEGFEWCVNALAVAPNGTVYANSEDGNLYAVRQGGTLEGQLFLDLATAAAYTPLSIGADGKIYSQNNGHLFVVGRSSHERMTP